MAHGCELITLVGEIDMTRNAELRQVIDTFRASQSANAAVDMSQVSFFGSEGVGFLARLLQETRARAGTITLVNPSKAVARLITISGLDNLISQERRIPLLEESSIPVPLDGGRVTDAPVG